MLSTRLRQLPIRQFYTKQIPTLSRRFTSNNPAALANVQANKPLLEIRKYDGPASMKDNKHYIKVNKGVTMSEILPQLKGCEYEIVYGTDELFDAFSGRFDDKALDILRASSHIRWIQESGVLMIYNDVVEDEKIASFRFALTKV